MLTDQNLLVKGPGNLCSCTARAGCNCSTLSQSNRRGYTA
jgi:hypothetical protein